MLCYVSPAYTEAVFIEGSREHHQLTTKRFSKPHSLKRKEIPDFEPQRYVKHFKVTESLK